MEGVDQQAIRGGIELLELFKDVTGNGEMQMQSMLTLLYVAYRHPNSVPMREIETHFGFTQTTNSRNIGYWSMTETEVVAAARKRAIGDFASGKTAVKQAEGAQMFRVEVDPHYVKRKLITLTPKGVLFATAISQVLRVNNRGGIALAASERHNVPRQAQG